MCWPFCFWKTQWEGTTSQRFLERVEGRNEHREPIWSLKYDTILLIETRDILSCFLPFQRKSWDDDPQMLPSCGQRSRGECQWLLEKPASSSSGYKASKNHCTKLSQILRLRCKRTQTHGWPVQFRLHRLPKHAICNRHAFIAVTTILITLLEKLCLNRYVVCSNLSSTWGIGHRFMPSVMPASSWQEPTLISC